MLCPQCGAESAPGTAFCRQCGTKLSQDQVTAETVPPAPPAEPAAEHEGGPSTGAVAEVEPAAASEPTAESAVDPSPEPKPAVESAAVAVAEPKSESVAQPAPQPGAKKPAPNKPVPKKAVIAAIAIAAVALIAFTAWSLLGSSPKISAEQVESDLIKECGLTTGFLSSSYVEDTPYEVTSFEVVSTEKLPKGGDLTNMETYDVEVKGTVANESFESTFAGSVQYIWYPEELRVDDKEFVLVTDLEVADVSTKPLKGIDYVSDTDEDCEYENEEISFDEKDGTYTSVLTRTEVMETWFVRESVDQKYVFEFDEEHGWQAEGEPELSNQKTEWLIAGKTFELTEYPQSGNYDGSVVSSISLGPIDENGAQVSATYTYDYTTTQVSAISSSWTYQNVNLSGDLTGTVSREPGSGYAELMLKDEANGVSFTFSLSDDEEDAKAKCMHGSIETESVVLVRDATSTNDMYDASDLVYTMKDASE